MAHGDPFTDGSELGTEIIYPDLVQVNCTYRRNITTLDPKVQEMITPITCILHGCKKKVIVAIELRVLLNNPEF